MGGLRGAVASLVALALGALALGACGGGGGTLDAAAPGDAWAPPVDAHRAAPALAFDPLFAEASALSGTTSAPIAFTLTNRGDAPATMLEVTLGGRDPSAFQIMANACGPELAIGASCAVSVVLTPAFLDVQASLDARAIAAIASAPLTGHVQRAAVLFISPNPFDFGVAFGPTPPQTFVVNHRGISGNLTVSIDGANASDFTMTRDTCSGVLDTAPTCEIDVVFAPTANGPRIAGLTATVSSAGTTSASMVGTGALVAFELTPSAHDFGDVALGRVSAPFDFTVTNDTTMTLSPLTVAFSRGDAAAFSVVASTCTTDLPPLSSCVLSVAFAPAHAGAAIARMQASVPGFGGLADLTGNGVDGPLLALTPARHDFGTVRTSAPPFDFTLTNLGNAAGALTTSVTGSGAAAFPIRATTCGVSLAVGASCTVSIGFSPFSPTPLAASLDAMLGSSGRSASLSGAGTTDPGALLVVTPAAADFGASSVGAMGATRSFVVTNAGGGPATSLVFAASGPAVSDFVVQAASDSCSGATLAPGTSCTFDLTFVASALGARTTTWAVRSSNGSQDVADLTGNGL